MMSDGDRAREKRLAGFGAGPEPDCPERNAALLGPLAEGNAGAPRLGIGLHRSDEKQGPLDSVESSQK